MRESTFSALFGAMSNEARMDLIANNLANVNTTGFKRQQVAFKDTFIRFAHDNLVDAKPYMRDQDLWPKPHVMARPRLYESRTDFSQGSLQTTNNPLDFALVGNGFFKVRTPEGTEYFTRSGSFQIAGDGRLITEQGFEVVGQGGGGITLPRGSQVQVDAAGQIRSGNEVVGALQISAVSDMRALEQVGGNLYRLRPNSRAEETAPTELTVQQGALEKPNVEVVSEMVAMIEVQRAFEMYQKVITGTDEMDRKVITQVGRPT